MKRRKMWKAVLSALFVVFAGMLYACGGKGQAVVELAGRKDAPADDLHGSVSLPEPGGADSVGKAEQDVPERKSTAGPTAAPVLCYVHVCGAVKRPGVYALAEDSRVADAIAAAGGLTEDAAGDYLNQARRVADGEQLYVPDAGEAELLAEEGRTPLRDAAQGVGTAPPAGSGSASSAGSENVPPADVLGAQRVNINTATKEQLMGLNGIGASRAEAILAYRREHGEFRACEDLMKVNGIKEAVYQKLCEYITVGNGGS